MKLRFNYIYILIVSLFGANKCCLAQSNSENAPNNIISIIDKSIVSITDSSKNSLMRIISPVKESPNKIISKIDSSAEQIRRTASGNLGKGDSVVNVLQNFPDKYFSQINNKVDKYTSRVTRKTEKTLKKLSKWENKIKRLLEKTDPELAARLFTNDKITFTSLLKQLESGEQKLTNYKSEYNSYQDKLTTNINYLKNKRNDLSQSMLAPLDTTAQKIKMLSKTNDNVNNIKQTIKERKKLLIESCIKHLNNNKYLKKIDKETWYYTEAIKNYKTIFSDTKKTEEFATNILSKIPEFQEFKKENNQLTSLFGLSGFSNSSGGTSIMQGLQSRTALQDQIKQHFGSNVSTATLQQTLNNNVQEARATIDELKNKATQLGGKNKDGLTTIPDFKPNTQKTKLFAQRLEYGMNFQFAKTNSFMPTTADVALNIGYKLNDKNIIGIGASYKLGLGSIERIRLSNQGIGLRSYLDWKLKKNIFISGGYEHNYLPSIILNLQTKTFWQQAGLIGITKKINIKSKWAKVSKVQLLYDFLSKQHFPASQPILFRTGYDIK